MNCEWEERDNLIIRKFLKLSNEFLHLTVIYRIEILEIVDIIKWIISSLFFG